jgi:hypothetical protein
MYSGRMEVTRDEADRAGSRHLLFQSNNRWQEIGSRPGYLWHNGISAHLEEVTTWDLFFCFFFCWHSFMLRISRCYEVHLI